MATGPAATEARHLRTLFAVGAAGGLTDGQLLERFANQAGDPAELAFAALVERHGPMVLRVARSALREDHSAHDAFQATFLILARKARSLWVRDSLGPWLHAVAHRVASQGRSAQARRRLIERQAARSEAYQGLDADRSDLALAIHQEIERLPQTYRLAVVTCHLEGLTQHEAADRLGWPVGTLQSRLARGRRKLREGLRRRGLAPSLGVLGGKLAPVPPALAASTARLAATLHLKATSAGMIAPAVLAMIETTTKGMLMMKLKLGALALLTAFGIVAATGTINLGQEARRGDTPPASLPVRPDESQTATDEPLVLPRPQGQVALPQPHSEVRSASSTPPHPLEPVPTPLDGLGFPVLLGFHAKANEASAWMRPRMARLADLGFPIKLVDAERSLDLARRYHISIKELPIIVLVDGNGAEIKRLRGENSAAAIADFYNDSRPKDEAQPALAEATSPEPSLDVLPAPRPWETVVRVRVIHNENESNFGSGAVVASTEDETFVLTTWHTFKPKGPDGKPIGGGESFSMPKIRVDLFDGKLAGRAPAKVGPGPQDFSAELIDRDELNNLALIRIHPGRVVPASRVASGDRKPVRGMRLYSLGCTRGDAPSAWDTVVLDPSVSMTHDPSRSTFTTIQCAYEPAPGRSGGGLYTADGELMGICLFADPHDKVGLYAQPLAIHNLLNRNGLAYAHGIQVTRIALPQTKRTGHDPILNSGRVYEERRAGKNQVVPNPELLTPQLPTDRERLDELERKLDRVLKALEGLKTDSPIRRD